VSTGAGNTGDARGTGDARRTGDAKDTRGAGPGPGPEDTEHAQRAHATVPPHPHLFDPLAALRAPGDPACDVYLAGTVFLDIIFTGLDSAPVRGTESWARGMGSSPGGVANMATALARLGLRTSLAAAFGDDMYGDYCREALDKGEGIDLTLSHTVPGWHSPVTVSMAYEGERTMVSHGHEAPPRETPPLTFPYGAGSAGSADVVDGTDSRDPTDAPDGAIGGDGTARPGTAKANVPLDPEAPGCPPPARACVTSLAPGESQDWIGVAARRGSRVFADVGWDGTGRWDLAALPDLEHCEAFLPNAEEAMRYTRTDCPRTAAHALAEKVPLAVVTLGAQGSFAVDGRTGESAEAPGIPVDALDTTGAGDVFVAGFVMGSLAGWPLADRLAFAGLTAALSVQEFGGSLSAPGWPEIAAWWRHVRTAAPGTRPRPADRTDPGPVPSTAHEAPAPPCHPDNPYARTYAFLDAVLTGCPGPGPRRRALPTLGFGRGTGPA
jgi:sugar/nucleoside kinase (ribokinase family)